MESYRLVWLVSLVPLLLIPSCIGAQTANPSDTSTSNATSPQDTTALEEQFFTQGNDLFNAGKYLDSITYYDKALSINPNDTDVLYQKGRALNNINKYDDAISYYDKVLSIEPNYTDALRSKGISLDNLGQSNEAITYYDKVLAIEPNDTSTLYRKGLSLENMGKNDQAIASFNETINVDPTHTDAMYQIGLILEKLGKKDEAISYYDKILAIDPQNTLALNSKNLALGQPVQNKTQGPQMDQGILIVIGVVIAAIFGIIVIKRTRTGKQEIQVETRRKEKIETKSRAPITRDEDHEWKGI